MPGDWAPGGAIRVSVVIPAFNEQGNIGRLIEETYATVPDSVLGEVIVVDDASDDGTAAEVKALVPHHGTLRYLRHGRRAGQSASLRTAILASRFPVIATMDGDGQNDPADIAPLFEKLGAPGSEPALVGGVRAARKDTGSKRFASRFANWLRDRVLNDGCPDTGCGIKVYQRDAFLALPFFTSMHRYLPAFFQTYGHQVSFAPVNDRPRLAGQSKYTNLGRALIGIHDLVGVSWLRKRTDLPPLAEQVQGDAAKSGERRIRLVRQRG
ncbi:glycosyltransferase family 2 protein [Methyloceanibacter sp.]|uniref:glycosyltransferase family 2 protein n=1 Tax=Methyloceanibacter sp. TaxID=1965321 RepID=UPI002CAD6000|nr:glycosyltransferase family 2 protein [Methyloceanibacter sp.]HML93047.1 glycosyltransferase family 2 protein [Methyloceanibacter sp.]